MEVLTLTLLVAWVFADNTNDSFAADNAAKFAKGFNRGADSHDSSGWGQGSN